MASPTTDFYGVASGQPVAGGRSFGALIAFSATMSSGQCIEFSAPSLTVADSTGSRPFLPPPESGSGSGTLDWCSNLPYDPVRRRVICAGGRPANQANACKLIYYDLRDDEWDSVANPFGTGGGHLYQSQCVASSINRFFYLPIFGNLVVQCWNTQTWSADSPLPAIPGFSAGTSAWGDAIALMWNPNMGSQGSIVAAGGNANYSRIARFDWASQTWTELMSASAAGCLRDGHNAGVYVPAADKCIVGKSSVGNQRQLYIVDAAGVVTQTSTYGGTVSAYNGAGILTPHPSRDAAIHFCLATGRIWSYEFSTDQWVDRAALPSALNNIYEAGATINDVVFAVVGTGGVAVGGRTYVYKPDF